MNHLSIIVIIEMFTMYHSIMSYVALIIKYHATMFRSNRLFPIKTPLGIYRVWEFQSCWDCVSVISYGWLK